MTDSTGASDAVAAERAVAASSTPPTPAVAPGSAQDWTDQVTGLIVDNVDKVRSRTTGPILEVTRGSVHAVVALLLVAPVTVLFTILAVRLLTYYVFREVWITYTVLGMLFTLTGVVLWSRRHAGVPRS